MLLSGNPKHHSSKKWSVSKVEGTGNKVVQCAFFLKQSAARQTNSKILPFSARFGILNAIMQCKSCTYTVISAGGQNVQWHMGLPEAMLMTKSRLFWFCGFELLE